MVSVAINARGVRAHVKHCKRARLLMFTFFIVVCIVSSSKTVERDVVGLPYQPHAGREDADEEETFTVVINTFKRRRLLQQAVAHYASCQHVAEIRVVWSEQVTPPSRGDYDAHLYYGPHPELVKYDSHPTTSIQNRFDVRGLRTSSVFNVDDDVRIPCSSLVRGHAAWKANRDVLVGFSPRMHRWNPAKLQHDYICHGFFGDFGFRRGLEFSIILTKAAFCKAEYLQMYVEAVPEQAKSYVDALKNCEDIAMQILVSSVSQKPPVYVQSPMWYYLLAKWRGFGVTGISTNSGHLDVRGRCITDLSQMMSDQTNASTIDRTPLIATPLVPWRAGNVDFFFSR
mmetsp:Transcript_14749/g.63326  ORF Transcript_14749/g.63326 Transcript_14749/m.63326 type:complete len:342 (-) Transcript_14749:2042-3067(-)